MAVHIEHLEAAYTHVAYVHEDPEDPESVLPQAVLVLSADELVVIHGTQAELLFLLERVMIHVRRGPR